MDEKIVKERLEETISYNVSNEKKWYIRIIPLFIKNMAMNAIFLKSSKAYTMTLSNLGPVSIKTELENMVDAFPRPHWRVQAAETEMRSDSIQGQNLSFI